MCGRQEQAVTQRSSKLLPICPSLKQAWGAPASKGLNQERMVITELRMPCHISATLSYVAVWEGSVQLSISSPVGGKVFSQYLHTCIWNYETENTAQHLGTKSVRMFPKDLPLHLPAFHVGEHCSGPTQAGAVPAKIWSSPMAVKAQRVFMYLAQAVPSLGDRHQDMQFPPTWVPVSVSGNRVVLCPCNGSVSLYFLPVPSSDWLSPSCGEQKPEAWATFIRGKKGFLFLLK